MRLALPYVNISVPLNSGTLESVKSKLNACLVQVGFSSISSETLRGPTFIGMLFSGIHITTLISTIKFNIKNDRIDFVISFKNFFVLMATLYFVIGVGIFRHSVNIQHSLIAK